MVSRNAFKARLTALESLRMIWTINVSSEIRTRSEDVLERFYAMVVFGRLSGRQSLRRSASQNLPHAYARAKSYFYYYCFLLFLLLSL